MKNDVIYVDADALREVLVALNGPGHHIHELQATRGTLLFDNPIDKLVTNYNDAIARAKAAAETEAVTDAVDKVEYPHGEVAVIGVPGGVSCLISRSLPVGTHLYGPPTFSGYSYHAADGTLMNAEGTRSVFDDVDK